MSSSQRQIEKLHRCLVCGMMPVVYRHTNTFTEGRGCTIKCGCGIEVKGANSKSAINQWVGLQNSIFRFYQNYRCASCGGAPTISAIGFGQFRIKCCYQEAVSAPFEAAVKAWRKSGLAESYKSPDSLPCRCGHKPYLRTDGHTFWYECPECSAYMDEDSGGFEDVWSPAKAVDDWNQWAKNSAKQPSCPYCKQPVKIRRSKVDILKDGKPNPNYGRAYHSCSCRGNFFRWAEPSRERLSNCPLCNGPPIVIPDFAPAGDISIWIECPCEEHPKVKAIAHSYEDVAIVWEKLVKEMQYTEDLWRCLNCQGIYQSHNNIRPTKCPYCDRVGGWTKVKISPPPGENKEDNTMDNIKVAFEQANTIAATSVKLGAQQAIAVTAKKAIMEQVKKLLGDSFPEEFYATPLGEAVIDLGACHLVNFCANAFPTMAQELLSGVAEQAKLAGLKSDE